MARKSWKLRSRKPTEYMKSTRTVRLTIEVRDWITDHASRGESIDNALRRLLKIPNGHQKAAAGGK